MGYFFTKFILEKPSANEKSDLFKWTGFWLPFYESLTYIFLLPRVSVRPSSFIRGVILICI